MTDMTDKTFDVEQAGRDGKVVHCHWGEVPIIAGPDTSGMWVLDKNGRYVVASAVNLSNIPPAKADANNTFDAERARADKCHAIIPGSDEPIKLLNDATPDADGWLFWMDSDGLVGKVYVELVRNIPAALTSAKRWKAGWSAKDIKLGQAHREIIGLRTDRAQLKAQVIRTAPQIEKANSERDTAQAELEKYTTSYNAIAAELERVKGELRGAQLCSNDHLRMRNEAKEQLATWAILLRRISSLCQPTADTPAHPLNSEVTTADEVEGADDAAKHHGRIAIALADTNRQLADHLELDERAARAGVCILKTPKACKFYITEHHTPRSWDGTGWTYRRVHCYATCAKARAALRDALEALKGGK